MSNQQIMDNFQEIMQNQKFLSEWVKTQDKIIPETLSFSGTIIGISYAAFKVLLEREDNNKKVVYVHRFPPSDNTVCPIFSSFSNEKECEVENISLDEGESFWSDQSQYQVNGSFKGGSWGLDNYLPTSSWMKHAFIGDRVIFDFVENGILKFDFSGKPFQKDTVLLENTMNTSWSCNIINVKNGHTYASYVMDYYMPQYANDVLFIWNNPSNGQKFVKVLKRGDKPTVDMQNKLMPGAGEHLEAGERLKFKSTVMRAFSEELGLDSEVLPECYLIDLGQYDDLGRDPRYWTYTLIGKDGIEKTFGSQRYSCTHGYVLYYNGEAPKLQEALDNIEVVELGPLEKRWVDLETIDVSGDEWMLLDHAKIVNKAKEVLPVFDVLLLNEKECFKFSNVPEKVLSL